MAIYIEYLIYFSAFIIGSIPFGVLVAKSYGVKNLTSIGSGNSGATNVVRVVGKKAGAITLLLDFLKAYIPLILLPFIITKIYGLEILTKVSIINLEINFDKFFFITASMLVLGHCFSIFRKFKGGKGVATGLGVVFAINPLLGLVYIAIWLLFFAITKISSISALASFGLSVFIALFLGNYLMENEFLSQNKILSFLFFLTVLIYYKHIPNITKIFKGEEKPFGK